MTIERTVIEAAAEAIVQVDRRVVVTDEDRAAAEAAVMAADAARAERVKELMKTIRVCSWKKRVAAERDLFALLNIPDAS